MGILLNYFKNIFEIFKKHCSYFNKYYKITKKTNEFNTCTCSQEHICALGSQCKVSALVFNFIFGEPSKDMQEKEVNEMIRIIDEMSDNSYVHFMIAVHSITRFVGHRFIIFVLKENQQIHIFKIQSYVNSYTTRIDKISEDELKTQMGTFISIFEKPNSSSLKTTQTDCDFWKTFAFEDLPVDVEIPNHIHVFNYYQSEPNLNESSNFLKLKERIKGRIELLLKEPQTLFNFYIKSNKLFEDVFGFSNINQKLNPIIQKIQNISKQVKDFTQKTTNQQKTVGSIKDRESTVGGNLPFLIS